MKLVEGINEWIVCTSIIVSSTWFCQGQGYRLHGCRGIFVVFHSKETVSCLKWNSCMRNERCGGRGVHKNSGSSAKAVALALSTPGIACSHMAWFGAAPGSWVYCLIIQALACFTGMTFSVWWKGWPQLYRHVCVGGCVYQIYMMHSCALCVCLTWAQLQRQTVS